MRSPSTLPGWREGKKLQWTTSQSRCGKSPRAGASELRCCGRNDGAGCSKSARPLPVPAARRTCRRRPTAQAHLDSSGRATKGLPHAGALRRLGRSLQRTRNEPLSPSFVVRSVALRRSLNRRRSLNTCQCLSPGQKRPFKDYLQAWHN